MKPVKIGIAGLGTVGCGTVNVLERNGDEISRRAGRAIRVTRALVRDPRAARDCRLDGVQITTDPQELIDDPEIQVIVELVGGTDGIAHEIVMASIDKGKHVVTANKALIAVHGNTIFERAQARGVMVAFEAAVAGGICIIKVIREGLSGNRVNRLAGIINGTGNYILSEMRSGARTFEDVLAEAQRLGYAESDPTFDVEGVDAAHKLTILASIAFGIPLQFSRVYTEGISRIRQEDVENAAELGYRIKHLGIASRVDNGFELRVHPCMIPEQRLLANVEGVMNAILVEGDAVGPTLHYGAGAGADPTASAVVADLVDVVRALTTDPNNRVPHLAFQPGSLSDLPVLHINQIESAYYLHLKAVNRPGVLADITRILGDLSISIQAIQQKGNGESESIMPIVIVTHRTREEFMDQALARLSSLGTVTGEITRIRLEPLEWD
ncbi:MAG: homoserine dehydrogenase [Proteobacteria bacterium]|nr:MAG: homoserine dehydrogenase [Pseudomonadota bacterium]